MAQDLTKDEKKALRQLEWREKEKIEARNATIKKYSIWTGSVMAILLAIGGLMWLVNTPPTPSQSEAVNVMPISRKDITVGNPDVKIKLIEYADFQCPACAAYHAIVTQLLETYKDKIFYVYRMFPLTNIHPNSHISAQAAYAAHKQGAFFKYDDLLYDKQNEWSGLPDPKNVFIEYAKLAKLDIGKFTADMNSDEAKKYVNDSEQEAQNAGINATPTFILNGNKITNPNSLEDFKKLIDIELNK
jgi:protein-disulfide isomerase